MVRIAGPTAERNVVVADARESPTSSIHLCKELAVVCLGVADGWRCFWLVECVASLVLFAHPIDDEHDDDDREYKTDDHETDTD